MANYQNGPVFNPYYGNNQMMNPIMAQQPQQQHFFQPQQTVDMTQRQQQAALPGRIVENADILKTMEIPMDGYPCYFPKADGSEIYTKRWLENGSTQTLRYVLKTDEEQQAEDNFLVDKLNSIEEQLNNLQKAISKPSGGNQNRNKNYKQRRNDE